MNIFKSLWRKIRQQDQIDAFHHALSTLPEPYNDSKDWKSEDGPGKVNLLISWFLSQKNQFNQFLDMLEKDKQS